MSSRARAVAVCAALLASALFPLPALAAAPAGEGGGPAPRVQSASEPFFHNYSSLAGLSANATILDAARAAREYGAGFLNGGRGACWFDYDLDFDDDLYVVGPGKNELYRNDGNWTFADVTDTSGLGDTGYGMGCGAADLDNDGDPDLWATNYDSYQSIFRNNGDGTFTNLSSTAIAIDPGAHTGVAFGDFDRDGLLDVFVTNYNRQQDKMYRNLGNFVFEERWNGSAIFDTDFGFQPLVFDFDLDGDVDVYVINDFSFDRLWKNEGNWSFSDASGATELRDPRGGMGGDVSDVDHDGGLDVYVANYQENGLWIRNGSRFDDRAKSAGVDNTSTGWASVFFDYDNDGWEDLFVANGAVDRVSEFHQSNILYHNMGNLTFGDVSAGSGAEGHEDSRSTAMADVDHDGRVDLYVTNVNAPNEMLRNVYNSTNSWIGLRLEGTLSNRDAVGAIVRVKFGNTTLVKPVMQGAGYLGTHSRTLHFGLGNASAVSSIEVTWPSGLVQTTTAPPLNVTTSIRETDIYAPIAIAQDVSGLQGISFGLDGSASTDNVAIAAWNWSVNVNGTIQRASGTSASMTVYTPGTFAGTLSVRDVFGNVNATGFQVTVTAYNAAWVDAGPDFSVPEGTLVTFNATGGSSATPDFLNSSTFVWNFTDGGVPRTLSGPRPSYTFPRMATIEVRVFVADIAGNTAQDTVNVTVLDRTGPSIVVVAPASADEDWPVPLDATGTTDNDRSFPAGAVFSWSYAARGANVTFTGANVTHAFDDPGDTWVTLSVTDASGNSATRPFLLRVVDTTAPTANAGPDKTMKPGEQAVLSAAASTDNALDFASLGTFVWTIHLRGTDQVETGVTAVVSFTVPGHYVVELNVTDPSGNHAVANDTMVLVVQDLEPPTPSAGGDRTVNVGTLVVLNGSLTVDNDPDILETGVFLWEFQDGAVRQRLLGVQADYTFSRTGDYRVRLSVYDAGGNSAAALFTIHVVDANAPVIVATVGPSELVAGASVTLNATGTTDDLGVVSVVWRVTGPFAFDQLVVGLTGAVVLGVAGTYNATVTAKDSAGNLATRSFEIRVAPKPAPPPGGGGEEPPPGGGETPPPGGGNETVPPAFPVAVFALVGIGAGAAAGLYVILWRKRLGRQGGQG